MSEKLCNGIEWDLTMQPKMIYVRDDISMRLSDVPLSEAITTLKNLEEEYPPDTMLVIESYHDYDSSSYRVTLEYSRLQTEQEMAKEALEKRKQDGYRRQRYEALKEEFEK